MQYVVQMSQAEFNNFSLFLSKYLDKYQMEIFIVEIKSEASWGNYYLSLFNSRNREDAIYFFERTKKSIEDAEHFFKNN